jgi:hypothetical protein
MADRAVPLEANRFIVLPAVTLYIAVATRVVDVAEVYEYVLIVIASSDAILA